MYNRYIPQSDGSYHRNRMPDRPDPPKQSPAKPQETSHSPEPTPRPIRHEQNITGFLKQLLPREFDTGDLLIVLLLLLMAGDSEEHKNNALLTLALYFFM